MRVRRLSLQAKIIIIIATAVVLVVSVSTYIAMWLTREPVEEEIYRKALAQARLTTHQLTDRDALQDPARLLKTLKQMEHDLPGVEQSDVYLHGADPRLVATTNPRGEHLELDNLPKVESYNEFYRPSEDQVSTETPEGKFWVISTVIRSQGRPLGCLVLKVSKSRLNAVTLDLVQRNLLLLLASLGVVSLGIHLFFLRGVRRPVKEMIRVMETAEGGALNVRAGVASHDEIGELAEHLNRMLAQVENFNAELGRKVKEATTELAVRNEELKSINEELYETQKSLARSERLAVAGQLAASLAHEIGTPLNSISGHVQLLGRRKTWDEVSQRRVEIIEKQVDSIVRTVKQLLSWTRKFDLRMEPVDLRRLLKESLLVASPALQHRKIEVRMDLPRDCPSIVADAAHLQQVFLNLINNSMDAMPEGGELRVKLRYAATGNGEGPNCKGDGGEVTVEVSDTGHGINPDTLPHIFEPMFTTKRIGTGAGLGLAICQQIVRQHGGTIEVESELRRGTRFTIRLPRDSRDRLEAAASAVVGSQ
jgi:two-component system, NtrC family, sensor kinase